MPRQVHPPKPSEALTLGVRAFIGHFFNVSDRPECNEEWVDSFCDEATLVMGPDVANGRQEIRTLREGMWQFVAARKHKVTKVFMGGVEQVEGRSDVAQKKEAEDVDDDDDGGQKAENECELIMFGNVEYRLKTREEKSVEWAAQGRVRKVNGKFRWTYYRVYLGQDS